MIPRSSIKRKYRPNFEALERKQLLSAGLPTYAAAALAQTAAPVSSQAELVHVSSCGTGKSVIIVTSW